MDTKLNCAHNWKIQFNCDHNKQEAEVRFSQNRNLPPYKTLTFNFNKVKICVVQKHFRLLKINIYYHTDSKIRIPIKLFE